MADLYRITRELMIVAGITMFITGLIGNILNIYVFYIWSCSRSTINRHKQTQRASNSSLYLFTSSIANLVVIIYSLPTRILFDGYQYLITADQIFLLCKFRYYCLHTCDLISLTCLCMATLDRYLISSREVRLRRMSATRQSTLLIILVIICVVGLHSIPIGIYYTASSAGQCMVDSSVYLYYYRYAFQIILHGIIPLLFFSFFGYLTYKQLKSIKTRQNQHGNFNIDKHLSRMLLLMSVAIVFSSIPYSIENSYYLIFADQQSSFISFFHTISSLLFYTNPVCCFYIYYVSTPSFRKQVQSIILCKKLDNRIVATQMNTVTLAQTCN